MLLLILFIGIGYLLYVCFKTAFAPLEKEEYKEPIITYSYNNIIEIDKKEDNDIQKIQLIEEKLDISKLESDKNTEIIYRPQSFDDFIGQENSKEILKIAIASSKYRKQPFPHTLLYGKSGQGKTTLARIITNEFKGKIVERIATSFKSSGDIIEAIAETKGEYPGILFIDEIHSLYPVSLVEFLYPPMEDFQIHGQNIIPFTLIGATTEKGLIIDKFKPFVRRFKIQITFEDYSEQELMTIIKNYGKKLFGELEITEKSFENIVKKSRTSPSVAIRLLESCRDYCLAKRVNKIDEELTNKILSFYQIFDNGLTKIDLEILAYLNRMTKAVGLNGISQFLETSQKNFVADIEPFLVKNEYILRTPRGRMIGQKGREILEKIKL